jgi:phage portal protein BeeE
MLVFSSIRFGFQRLRDGKPSGFFGTPDLRLLEYPFAGGTTQDLLMNIIVDADLAGNAYVARIGDEAIRLRPDWVSIVLEPRLFRGATLGYRRIGYIYQEGGFTSDGQGAVPLALDEVAHFAPHPDPLATYRGMSWLTPVIREVINDKLMSRHQSKFFENGATPNLVISMDSAVSYENFVRFKDKMNLEHRGVENAYKTLMVGGGADVTVVGNDFAQMAFTAVQGKGETRLAGAARVPVTIAGFSEGLQGSSLNAGNFKQAWRSFADATMHPLWQNIAGTLQTLVPAPPGARLWYDTRDVPALREDAKDAAEIMQIKATTLRSLVDGGWEPETAKAAVEAEDISLLAHTGKLSVQLQPTDGTAIEPEETVEGGEE